MAIKMQKARLAKGSAEIPTSSMADIVFLLLTFFLLVTSLNPDKGLGMTLPPPGEEVKVKEVLSVYINAEGQILVGENVVPVEELRKAVVERLRENPRLIVSLITDVKAEYRFMIDALDEIKLAFEDMKAENPDFKERISLATPVF